MIVFNLLCVLGHKFEGWFTSEENYQDQLDRSLLTCPVCGSQEVSKTLSAPHLHKKSNQKSRQQPALEAQSAHSEKALMSANAGVSTTEEHIQAAIAVEVAEEIANHIMNNTEDVGADFAEEARKIYYGETQKRSIRGQATMQEAQDLHEEGIDVVKLPFNAPSRKNLQ